MKVSDYLYLHLNFTFCLLFALLLEDYILSNAYEKCEWGLDIATLKQVFENIFSRAQSSGKRSRIKSFYMSSSMLAHIKIAHGDYKNIVGNFSYSFLCFTENNHCSVFIVPILRNNNSK